MTGLAGHAQHHVDRPAQVAAQQLPAQRRATPAGRRRPASGRRRARCRRSTSATARSWTSGRSRPGRSPPTSGNSKSSSRSRSRERDVGQGEAAGQRPERACAASAPAPRPGRRRAASTDHQRSCSSTWRRSSACEVGGLRVGVLEHRVDQRAEGRAGGQVGHRRERVPVRRAGRDPWLRGLDRLDRRAVLVDGARHLRLDLDRRARQLLLGPDQPGVRRAPPVGVERAHEAADVERPGGRACVECRRRAGRRRLERERAARPARP